MLRIEVPVKSGPALRVAITRDNIFRAYDMGKRYQKRSLQYWDQEDDYALQHMQGQLTQPETDRLTAATKAEEEQFQSDIWLELDPLLERW